CKHPVRAADARGAANDARRGLAPREGPPDLRRTPPAGPPRPTAAAGASPSREHSLASAPPAEGRQPPRAAPAPRRGVRAAVLQPPDLGPATAEPRDWASAGLRTGRCRRAVRVHLARELPPQPTLDRVSSRRGPTLVPRSGEPPPGRRRRQSAPP